MTYNTSKLKALMISRELSNYSVSLRDPSYQWFSVVCEIVSHD